MLVSTEAIDDKLVIIMIRYVSLVDTITMQDLLQFKK